MSSVIDPAEVRHNLVVQMQGIPGLIDLMGGDPANIFEYIEADGGNFGRVIHGMDCPSIMVYFEGIEPTRFPSRFRYRFGMAVKSDQPTSVYAAMLQGVSSSAGSDGLPLLNSAIHPRFRPMEIPTMRRLTIPLGAEAVYDYWEIATAFLDMGS